MVDKFIKVLFVFFCVASLFYLALPNYTFPSPPPGSIQSQEPADTETTLRRAYFTNYTRAQVLDWYKSQFEKTTLFGIRIPAYLLNYPPEDAQTIIRDQTRSTFLEEALHPFRESLYINGFEPSSAKDTILIEGRVWRQKIIVRFVPSRLLVRELIFLFTALMIIILYKAWSRSLCKERY